MTKEKIDEGFDVYNEINRLNTLKVSMERFISEGYKGMIVIDSKFFDKEKYLNDLIKEIDRLQEEFDKL